MSERRYDESETAEIFARASEAHSIEPRPLKPSEGWSLAELQEIGREAGIPAEQVAAAARALDRPPHPAPRRFLGLTIGVGRTAQLGRRIDDAEWERLVVLLRDTFDARGQVRVDGGLRQWTNGNLQLLVEPSADGDRVRLRTRNATAQAWLTVGLAMLATSGGIALMGALTGAIAEPGLLGSMLPIAGLGVGASLMGGLTLRRWAPTRLQQMEAIVRRLESGPLR